MTDVYIISVVLNDKVGLARTAASVLGQVGISIHWVIADGGSSDGSVELATRLERRANNVALLRGPDKGIYHGMNRALNVVPEDAQVWFLNAGDFFLSSRSVVSAAERTPAEGWSGGPMVLVSSLGQIHDITETPSLRSYPHRPGLHLPAQPTVLMAKSLFSEIGLFREDLRLASDGILYQRLAVAVSPVVYQDPLVAFTLGGRSSRHFRQTLLEFWGAGYRPSGIGTQIWERDVGQARTWMRGMKLGYVQRFQRLQKSTRDECFSFEHWEGHPTQGANLRCCIEMGQHLFAHKGVL